jgi:hypothetical protein
MDREPAILLDFTAHDFSDTFHDREELTTFFDIKVFAIMRMAPGCVAAEALEAVGL